MSRPPDEFEWIARLRPLTRGDPRALRLLDDAAVIPPRAGHELVISMDAMVEGVHVLAGESAELIARRLIRVSLSDLAAKAAEPFGYFLMTAWPSDRGWPEREAFLRGLAMDGEAFGLSLLGGDTVATPGALTVTATVLGWAPKGGAILRSTAVAGDALVVCGAIGDGWLGLKAARGEIEDESGVLAERYRLPRPLLELREAVRADARAAADVSDGLLADAGHIAEASGLSLRIFLETMPLSFQAAAWLADQESQIDSLLALAAGGDDYALVCAVDPDRVGAFQAAVRVLGIPAAVAGRFESGAGLTVTMAGAPVPIDRAGWRH